MAQDDEREREDSQKTPEQREAEAEKSRAEAEQARAEALKAQAETQRILLDIKSAELALKSQELSLKQTEMSTKVAEIELERKLQAREEELAGDKYHFVYTFDQAVGESSVGKCIQQLSLWSRTRPACDIEIVFDSPGGNVIDGMHLFDYLQFLRQKGHKITTVALGYAASMAGILLQAGDVRIMGREAYMLIHEIQAGAIGSIGKMEDEMKFLKKIQTRIVNIFIARSKVSRGFFVRAWRRKDWWMDADEVLKYGFCDAILTEPFAAPRPRKRSKKDVG